MLETDELYGEIWKLDEVIEDLEKFDLKEYLGKMIKG